MRKVPLLIAVLFSLGLATSALAAGYGAAGCGLGSLVFDGKTDMISQVLAGTTNGTSGNQTFGITSGTSNCDASGIVLAEKEQDIFVAQNFDSLAKDMASGQGEHLATLSAMMSCPVAEFASFTQKNYDVLYASTETTPAEMLDTLKVGMKQSPALSAVCGS